MTYQDILKELRHLSVKELKNLKVSIQSQLDQRDPELDTERHLIYTALKTELAVHQVQCTPRGVLLKDKEFKSGADRLSEFCTQLWPGLDRNARLLAYRACISLIIRESQHRGWDLRPRAVISRAKAIDWLFNAAYPGYVESGLAQWLFKHLSRRYECPKTQD